VRMISNIIGVEPELALTDRRCVPARFLAEGFTFRFPGLPEALADVLRLK
jgi:NAD dependent epimerase/dehydratase family enzyme